VRGSVGTSFKAPTFFENFATGFTVGNPGLTPERSRSSELGFEYASPAERLTFGVTGFWQRFRNLIQYVSDVAPGAPNYQNLAAASADGVEFEAAVRLGARTSIRGSYTRLDTKVTDAGADTGTSASFVKGDRLLRRPTHLATVGLHQSYRGNAIDLTTTYTGDRDDRDFSQFPAVPVVLKSFTRVDLAIVSPLKPFGNVEHPATVLRVENLFNKGYEQVLGFRSPGRTIFLGFRVGD
jgi:vitamin B12 transporter